MLQLGLPSESGLRGHRDGPDFSPQNFSHNMHLTDPADAKLCILFQSRNCCARQRSPLTTG